MLGKIPLVLNEYITLAKGENAQRGKTPPSWEPAMSHGKVKKKTFSSSYQRTRVTL